MPDDDQTLPIPSTVPSLLEDYRRQQDAARFHTSEVDRLQSEVLSAAEHEAAEIVTTARAEIRRIIVGARRDLLELAAQIQVITNPTADANVADPLLLPARDGLQLQDRLLDARHNVRHVLAEARPEIEHLGQDALTVRPVAALVPPAAPLETSIEPIRPFDEWRDAHEPKHPPEAPSSGRMARAWVAAFALISLMIVVGTLWWVRSGRATIVSTSPPATVSRTAAVPDAHEPPAAAPLSAVSSAGPSALPPTAPKPTSMSVVIEAVRPAWVRTTIDGQADAGVLLQAGQKKQVMAERDVLLRIGDAGAVRTSMNGAEPAIAGRDGEVVTRRFAIDEPAAPAGTPVPALSPRPADISPDVTGTTPR